MRLISNRISIDETKYCSIVILGKIERWKESLLIFWVLSWSFCGVVFINYFIENNSEQSDVALLVLVFFWLYFEIRILKVIFYRRKGFEQIKFNEETLSIRTKIIGNGKTQTFNINDIDSFIEIPYSSRNFFSFMDNSFWVIGGDRIYFDYFGKKVVFAKQINEDEVKRLLAVLNGQLKTSKRAYRKIKKQNQA